MGRKPSRGRSKTNYFHDIKKMTGCASYQQPKEAAKNRHTRLYRQGVPLDDDGTTIYIYIDISIIHFRFNTILVHDLYIYYNFKVSDTDFITL